MGIQARLRGARSFAAAMGTALLLSGCPLVSATQTQNGASPVLAYGYPAPIYAVGVAIANNLPVNSGAPLTSYSVSPALPAGLTIDPTTGVISGTPSAIAAVASYTITGTGPRGSIQATVRFQVAGPAFALNINAPASLALGDTCVAASVGLKDAAGNDTVNGSTVTVGLRTFYGLAFGVFSDSACGSAITKIDIPSGQVSAAFYLGPMNAGSDNLEATAMSVRSISKAIVTLGADSYIAVSPAGMNQPSSSQLYEVNSIVTAGVTCNSFDLSFQEKGAVLAAAHNGTISIFDITTGTGIRVFSDAFCQQPAPYIASAVSPHYAVPVEKGQTTVTVSVIVDQSYAGSKTVYADGGLTMNLTSINFNAVIGKFATQVTGFASAAVGVCSPIWLNSTDSVGNVSGPLSSPLTTTLTVPPGNKIALFSDPGCTQAATSATLPAGSDFAVIYGINFTGETVPILSQTPGGSTNFSFRAVQGSGNPVVYLQTPVVFAAGSCVAFQAYGLAGLAPTAPATALPFNLTTVSGSAGLTFYSDPACTQATSSFAIPAGSIVKNFYGKAAQAGSFCYGYGTSSLCIAAE